MLKIIVPAILLALIILATYFSWFFLKGKTSLPEKYSLIEIGQAQYKIEIANTHYLQVKGLSGRESLAKDSAMLFVFPKKKIPSFWMKGMNFPIDMIWIADRKVVGFEENVPASSIQERYRPDEAVDWVLEVNAGEVEKWDIKTGDTVNLKAI